MAVNLNPPKTVTNMLRASKPTPMESARLKPMRVANPKTASTTPRNTRTPGAPPFDPYAGLLLSNPYDPKTIQSTAEAGYSADTARANELAQMGLPSNDALTQQAAARAQGLGEISQALQAHLGQIQQAVVAQGTQQAAQLAGMDQQATSGHVEGAPVPTAPVAPTATLAGQTAGSGNYLGTVEAGAALGGAQNQTNAINAGATAVTNNDLDRQKALAGFLAGLPTVASRVSSMQDANQKTQAANAGEKLSVWTTLQNQIEQDKLSGDKTSLAEDQLAEKKWEAGQSNKTKAAIAQNADQTRTSVAGINAGARTYSADSSAASKALAAKTAVTVAKIRAGATITAADIRNVAKSKKPFKVTVNMPAVPTSTSGGTTTVKLPGRKNQTFTAAQWAKFLQSGPKGKRKLSILGLPEGAKIDYGSVSGGS